MTNKQYRRRLRALKRGPSSSTETERLAYLVAHYQSGELRAWHGKGNTRHRSTVAA